MRLLDHFYSLYIIFTVTFLFSSSGQRTCLTKKKMLEGMQLPNTKQKGLPRKKCYITAIKQMLYCRSYLYFRIAMKLKTLHNL